MARQSIYSREKIIKFIPNVSRIRSINILEIAVDIANLLPNRKDIKLTNLEIESEKNNNDALHGILTGEEDDQGHKYI